MKTTTTAAKPVTINPQLRPEKMVGKDLTRFVLLEPFVRDGVLYATNDQAAFSTPCAVSDGVLPAEALKASRKGPKAHRGEMLVSELGVETNSTIYTRPESVLPDAGRAFPAKDVRRHRRHSVNLSADLLISLLQSMGGGYITLHLDPEDSEKPILIERLQDVEEDGAKKEREAHRRRYTLPPLAEQTVIAKGVIMPMRRRS